ncbi:MAG TPA: hypothetical protein PLD19_04560 [Luteimonas sp.]|nr:hypothetical protein [Luteimonas sp.]
MSDGLGPESGLGTEPAQSCCTLTAGTTVVLEIVDSLDASLLKRGDRFRIALAEPVELDGVTHLPAGTPGEGEVVHAERPRAGGKAAELIIAARHLDADGHRIALRGLKFGERGRDQSEAAIALAAGAVSVAAPIAPLAMFIRGGKLIVDAGSRVTARIAQDVRLPQPADASGDSTSNAVEFSGTDDIPPFPHVDSIVPDPE